MSDNEKDETSSQGNFDSSVSYTGRVKWFNNKAGYGFVTIVGEGPRTGEDVFVHHSGVQTGSEQYKYLVQGEYATFNLKESDNDTHPFQVDNLTGIFGGKLMCETRSEQRQQREEHENSHPSNTPNDRNQGDRNHNHGDRNHSSERKRGRQTFRLHGSGPRDNDNGVWTLTREESGSNQRPRHNQRHRSNEHENEA